MTVVEFNHYSVMLHETIEQLNINPDGIYVDGTLGGGGHAYEVCSRLKNGHFYGIDQDDAAIAAASARLQPSNALEIGPSLPSAGFCSLSQVKLNRSAPNVPYILLILFHL